MTTPEVTVMTKTDHVGEHIGEVISDLKAAAEPTPGHDAPLTTGDHVNNPTNTAQPEYDNFTDTLPDCECRLIVEPLFSSDPQPPRPPFCSNCVDCGVDTMGENSHEIYMVFGSIWRASGVCECKLLCVGCLERRIGRLLHSGDFTRCPLNYLNAKGLRPVTPRLLHRLFTPYGKDNPFHDAVRRAHIFAQSRNHRT